MIQAEVAHDSFPHLPIVVKWTFGAISPRPLSNSACNTSRILRKVNPNLRCARTHSFGSISKTAHAAVLVLSLVHAVSMPITFYAFLPQKSRGESEDSQKVGGYGVWGGESGKRLTTLRSTTVQSWF